MRRTIIFNKLQECYKREKTMESAKELCQHILDTDSVDKYPQYKSLCNYMLLEGLCYDVGYFI